VHCRSGKDRTSMVLAAYLIKFEDYDVGSAIDKLLAVRQIAFSVEGWLEFAYDVLSHYQTHNRAVIRAYKGTSVLEAQ